MNVSRQKNTIIFSFRMFLKQKNISLNSIHSADFDEFKILRKLFQKPAQKLAEVFFLHRNFAAPIRIKIETKYEILIG